MTTATVSDVFSLFGLATQQERDKILSQGRISIFQEQPGPFYTTWISDGTGADEEGDICAELEEPA